MLIAFATATVAALLTVLAPRAHAAFYAAAGAVWLSVMIPSHTPPRDVLLASAIMALALLVFGVVRSGPEIRRYSSPNGWLIALIVVMTMRSAIDAEGPYRYFVIASGALTLGIAVIASVSWPGQESRQLIPWAVLVVLFVQLALTVTEEFLGLKAVWPLSNGSDNLTSRVNGLAPFLDGRALGSMGHPIPLGVLAGAAAATSWWLLVERRQRLALIPLLASAAVLLFSGTRSAVFALALAVAYLYISRAKLRALPAFTLGALAVVVVAATSDLPRLFGFSAVATTDSFTHRFGVLQLIPELFNRDLMAFFLGSGYQSVAAELSVSSVGVDGIMVFDQEYLRTAWSIGALGLLLLVASIVAGWRRGGSLHRMIIIILIVMLASWDALSWNFGLTLFVLAVSCPRARPPAQRLLVERNTRKLISYERERSPT
ncbi:hypothetical protein [Plantibacter sp. CFBP 8775]|uniref:hypothetical protein n=1 Tax=Plantibacter sp. CFBP 8775 TaxID=2774038 RepID=UPI00177AD9B3|nr:hypothetical protein [Plantibacter sp. CFBP 8775]MBD8104056.1 hypothetical protein [Plantibacter sp. CFBP 8775]